MGSKKIRDAKAYLAAQQKKADERSERIQQVAEAIYDVVLLETFEGSSLDDVAWKLRLAGILGQQDRVKNPADKHNSLAKAALWHAVKCGYVVQEKTAQSVAITSSCAFALPFRVVKKLEAKTDLEIIDLNTRDSVDEIRDTFFDHCSADVRRELSLH